jgi:hypothetical protein
MDNSLDQDQLQVVFSSRDANESKNLDRKRDSLVDSIRIRSFAKFVSSVVRNPTAF